MDAITIETQSGLIVVHALALAIAWGTRLANGSRLESLLQFGFLLAMLGVAACGLLCCQIELGFSIPSGVTLIVMVLAAVADFRPTQEPAGLLH
jgi:hypothetical protein